MRILYTLGLIVIAAHGLAAQPARAGSEVILPNFRFADGESLPELRIHYIALGRPRRDASGTVRNGVLILHGTTGSGSGFLSRSFAGELFGPGQLLDTSRYYVILPDGIGHGGSSKPSDGLHAHFPRYMYDDMVDAQHRLLVWNPIDNKHGVGNAFGAVDAARITDCQGIILRRVAAGAVDARLRRGADECVVCLGVRAGPLPRPHHLRGQGASESCDADRDRMRGVAGRAVIG